MGKWIMTEQCGKVVCYAWALARNVSREGKSEKMNESTEVKKIGKRQYYCKNQNQKHHGTYKELQVVQSSRDGGGIWWRVMP